MDGEGAPEAMRVTFVAHATVMAASPGSTTEI